MKDHENEKINNQKSKNFEVLKLLKISKAHRNLTEELVIREVDELKLSQVHDTPRNHVGEGVRWKIKVVEADRKFAGDLAREMVLHEVEDFQTMRIPISGRRIPVSELYCKNIECRSVHLERERGMVFVSWWVCWFLVFVWLLRKFWILRWS